MDAPETPPGSAARLYALPAMFFCVFGASAMILMQIVPGPMKALDFMVIGTVSVMLGLLVVFMMVIRSTKSGDMVFSRRPATRPKLSGTSMFNLNEPYKEKS